MDKRVLIIGGFAVGIGVGAFIFWNRRKKDVEVSMEKASAFPDYHAYQDWDGDEVGFNNTVDIAVPDIPEELLTHPAETIRERILSNGLSDVSGEFKEVPDEKPSLDEVLEEIGDNEEGGEEIVMTADGIPLHIHRERNGYGTEIMTFEHDLPVFSAEEWDSEGENVYLITKAEYAGDDWPYDDRKVVAWFPEPGVLADDDLTPMEVVDTVGPTAFMRLMMQPDSTVWVRNEEMAACYELSINPSVPFDEALKDAHEVYVE